MTKEGSNPPPPNAQNVYALYLTAYYSPQEELNEVVLTWNNHSPAGPTLRIPAGHPAMLHAVPQLDLEAV